MRWKRTVWRSVLLIAINFLVGRPLYALDDENNEPAEGQSVSNANSAFPWTSSRQQPSVFQPALDELADTIAFYASLRTRMLLTEAGEEMQTGSSRVGIHLDRQLSPVFLPKLSAIGRLEYQVNFIDNPLTVTASESTNSDLVDIEEVDALETRLGYVGLEFGSLASLSFGKQWSVYYDIAGWTDLFYVFGGSGLGAYNSGTDGGAGTGRADQAIQLRMNLQWLALGLQYQVQGILPGDARAAAASVILRPLEGLELGGAFNRVFFEDDISDIAERNGAAYSVVTGGRFTRDRFKVALSYSEQRQTEAGRRADQAVLVNGRGFEGFLRQGLTEHFGVLGGFNIFSADDDDLDASLDLDEYYLGVDWFFDPNTMMYAQGRLAGQDDKRALAVGLRYNIELSGSASPSGN